MAREVQADDAVAVEGEAPDVGGEGVGVAGSGGFVVGYGAIPGEERLVFVKRAAEGSYGGNTLDVDYSQEWVRVVRKVNSPQSCQYSCSVSTRSESSCRPCRNFRRYSSVNPFGTSNLETTFSRR